MYELLARRSVKVCVALASVTLIGVGSAVAWSVSDSSVSSARAAASQVSPGPSNVPVVPGVLTSVLPATPTVSPTPSATPTPVPTPKPLLAKGVEAPRDQIPWDQVGSGWTLALFSPKTYTDQYLVFAKGQQILYLVNPLGGRFNITAVAEGVYLTAWSSDLKRVSVETNLYNSASERYDKKAFDVDLVSGAQLPTPPVATPHPPNVPLIGKVSSVSWLATSDGSQRVFAAEHGLALVSSNGKLVRTFPAPKGYDVPGVFPFACQPIRWWAHRVVEIACTSTPTSQGYLTNVWALPLDGGSMTQLTNATRGADGAGDGVQIGFGYQEVWQTDFGRFATVIPGCGPYWLAAMSDSGKGSTLTVPVPKGLRASLAPVAVQHRAILFRATGCQGQGDSLRERRRSC